LRAGRAVLPAQPHPRQALWRIEGLLVSLPDIASGILYMAAGDKAEPFLPGVIGAGPEVLPVVRARDAVAFVKRKMRKVQCCRLSARGTPWRPRFSWPRP
jgi:hypothetical protein